MKWSKYCLMAEGFVVYFLNVMCCTLKGWLVVDANYFHPVNRRTYSIVAVNTVR